jgi:glucokinase
LKPLLLGDIGGTNARFALFEQGAIGPIERSRTADAPTFMDAVDAFLAPRGGRKGIGGAAIAVAGPVDGGRCALTNSPWIVDQHELQRALALPDVMVVNDFAAVARSLPRLGKADLAAIGGGSARPAEPAIALGPGTGLGVACLIRTPGGDIVIPSEGGHATLASASERQDSLLRHLRSRHGHVSIERVLSGNGLVALYEATAAVDGRTVPARDAAEITSGAQDGSCAVCRAALDMFCAILGSAAGNLALTFGARGGVYIAGGIVPRFVDYLAHTEFREQFEAKGRFRGYLQNIPTSVITHPEAAMLGLASLFESGKP